MNIDELIAQHPWVEDVRDEVSEKCGGCGALLGEPHRDGCDWRRCTVCKGQYILCGHDDEDNPELFLGFIHYDAAKVAVENGLFCRDFLVRDGQREVILPGQLSEAVKLHQSGEADIEWHRPCQRGDEGARIDLNRGIVAYMASLQAPRECSCVVEEPDDEGDEDEEKWIQTGNGDFARANCPHCNGTGEL